MNQEYQHRKPPHTDDLWNKFLSRDASSLKTALALLNKVTMTPNEPCASPRPITLVSDACAIFDELAYIKRGKNTPSAYQEMSISGVCSHHSPDWVKMELETSVIPNFANYHGVSESETIDWVENKILPLIKIHAGYSEIPEAIPHSPLDPKDAPYVKLFHDLKATGIISTDTDIDTYGVRRIQTIDLSELLYLARCEHAAAMTKTFGHVGGRIVMGTTDQFFKSGVKAFGKLTPAGKFAVLGTGAIGLGVWLSKDSGRAQALKLLEKTGFGALQFGAFTGSGIMHTHDWEEKIDIIRKNYAA